MNDYNLQLPVKVFLNASYKIKWNDVSNKFNIRDFCKNTYQNETETPSRSTLVSHKPFCRTKRPYKNKMRDAR